jgi:predicted O-methyltransferase YrrM
MREPDPRAAAQARPLSSGTADPHPLESVGMQPPRRLSRPFVALRNMLLVERVVVRPRVWTSLRLAHEAQLRGAMQKLAELAPLLTLLARRRPAVVVEIGTYRGGSFYAFCHVAEPQATLVSIDLPGGLFGGGYDEEQLRSIGGYGFPTQSLHFLARDSQDVATRDEVAELLDDHPIDFLMIDGDHQYEGVRRDFELYSPLVAPSGLVAFHDILPHPRQPLCEVHVFWNEVKSRYRHIELTDAGEDWGVGQWGGIGVLFWRDTRCRS